jgi:hypothetical protein
MFINLTSGPNQGKFDLTKFLSKPKPTVSECRDISSILLLCFETQGMSCSLQQFWGGLVVNNAAVMFLTNPIRATGLGSYKNTSWAFHQVVERTSGGSSTVYDSCAKQQYDLSGATFFDTPFGWPETQYWQTAKDATFLGLVNGWTAASSSAPLVKANALLQGPYLKGVSILQGVF